MIIRTERKKNFTALYNSILEDQSLDWKELGMLAFLLSMPDTYEISAENISKLRKTGINGVYAILKRLRDAGYITVKKLANGKTEWKVYDFPYHIKRDNIK